MSLRLRVWIASATLAVAAVSPRANADDDALERADRLRHFVVLGNPLGFMIGRYSAEVQLIPVMHHAVVINPFVNYVSGITPLTNGDKRGQLGYGAEIAYHFYSGTRGPNGLFAGAGAIFGHTHLDAGSDSNEQLQPAQDFAFAGGLLDVGAQGVLDSGFTVGGGAGLQITKTLEASNAKFEPRLLFSIGYAF